MLKAVSTITNAIGALNFKGTWNASTNTPTLASGVGTKGDYFVVGVAGTTNLDGISNWGVGDWAAYNGSVWQRVEGGADLNGVNLTVSGTSLLSGNTGVGGDTSGVVAGVAITSKFCVKNEGANPVAGFVHVNDTTAGSGSVTFACRSRGTLAAPTVVQNNDSLWNMYIAGNDGTDLALAAEIRVEVDGTPGNNDMPGRIVLGTTPDGTQSPVDRMKIDNAGDITALTGNFVVGTSGKGIDFSATPGTGTSELLDDYEEGTWTPTATPATSGTITIVSPNLCAYTKIGRVVTVNGVIEAASVSLPVGASVTIGGLPFTSNATSTQRSAGVVRCFGLTTGAVNTTLSIVSSTTDMNLHVDASLFQLGSQVYFQLSYTV